MNPNDDQAKPQGPTADQEAALDALVAESQALGAYDAKPQVHAELLVAREIAKWLRDRADNLGTGGNVPTMNRRAAGVIDRLVAALSAPPVVAQPVAWRIDMSDGRYTFHAHNAIGDYRMIDPKATSTPLYTAPQCPD